MTSTNALAGVTVAITRAAHQADRQRNLLEAQGAQVVHYPCIEILPPRDTSALDEALRQAARGAFDWLVITSANTVSAIAERLAQLNIGSEELAKLQVAAVGSVSAQSIRDQLGLEATVTPERFTASELASAMQVGQNARILLPQSALARPSLLQELHSAGAEVTQVEAYRNVVASGGDPLPVLLWEGKIDAITFTSESTVRFFNKRLLRERGSLAMLHDVVVACIGPITAQAAVELGLDVAIMPTEHTLEGLTSALLDYFHEPS